MNIRLPVSISHQPDDVSCGPTCLQAVYRFYGDDLPVNQLLDEVRMLEDGGTMAVFLANHALRNGYRATIYTYNLQLFDPTWFGQGRKTLTEKLQSQAQIKTHPKLGIATKGYLEFLDLGGRLRFRDLSPRLIRRYLGKNIPILTGLSSTYLYHSSRENPLSNVEDDTGGEPAGHFVILRGYDSSHREVMIADPWEDHPFGDHSLYSVSMERLMGAILLGIVTYDANLLIIEPARERTE